MTDPSPDVPIHRPTRVLAFPATREGATDPTLEWLVTNGLGGYASMPVVGGLTRQYHGLLIAALQPPIGRLVAVNALRTWLVIGARRVLIDHENLQSVADSPAGALREFRLDGGLPVWRYEVDGFILERRVVMPRRRNTTCLMFRLLGQSGPATLECQPLISMRPLEQSIDRPLGPAPDVRLNGRSAVVAMDTQVPAVRLTASTTEAHWEATPGVSAGVDLTEEHERGYTSHGELWAPCRVTLALDASSTIALVLSTETDEEAERDAEKMWTSERARRSTLLMTAGNPTDAFEAELALAADQFIVLPVGHAAAVPSADAPPHATPRSIIAGYHWFTDWGRDTMISLDGLALATGRHTEASQILQMFGGHLRDGLIPNLFPEGQRLGLYHTADATLWFFEALHRYTSRTSDGSVIAGLLPALVDVLDHHRRGTRFGIGVDASDGLLRQGADGYALTWMDAKVHGRVITPRRGKAVEINALWYNALCLMETWLSAAGRTDDATTCHADAERARVSFNRRFWNAGTGCLFDVVDGEHGDDPACRPNQIFAVSLPHAVLDRARWAAVVGTARAQLLTPFGLRTLAPGDPQYQSQYAGDLTRRDEAYHQGTVWPWLIGAYVDALLKLSPDDIAAARAVLEAFPAHLSAAGIGSISEIFDADMPHLPRGCIAQAWSVAEVLRAWKKTAPASPFTPRG